jgi:hypothetical protein
MKNIFFIMMLLMLVTSNASAKDINILSYSSYQLEAGNCTLLLENSNDPEWMREIFDRLHEAKKCIIIFSFSKYEKEYNDQKKLTVKVLQELVSYLNLETYNFIGNGPNSVHIVRSMENLPRLKYAIISTSDFVKSTPLYSTVGTMTISYVIDGNLGSVSTNDLELLYSMLIRVGPR